MQLDTELIKNLQCKMFSDRGTDIDAAYEYMLSIAKASEHPPAVITAAHVLINTICNALLAGEEK